MKHKKTCLIRRFLSWAQGKLSPNVKIFEILGKHLEKTTVKTFAPSSFSNLIRCRFSDVLLLLWTLNNLGKIDPANIRTHPNSNFDQQRSTNLYEIPIFLHGICWYLLSCCWTSVSSCIPRIIGRFVCCYYLGKYSYYHWEIWPHYLDDYSCICQFIQHIPNTNANP